MIKFFSNMLILLSLLKSKYILYILLNQVFMFFRRKKLDNRVIAITASPIAPVMVKMIKMTHPIKTILFVFEYGYRLTPRSAGAATISNYKTRPSSALRWNVLLGRVRLIRTSWCVDTLIKHVEICIDFRSLGWCSSGERIRLYCYFI